MDPADLDHFIAALRQAMRDEGLNQSQLGRAAGVAPSMISAWLDAKTRSPEPGKVFAVEQALNMYPGELSKHLGYAPVERGTDHVDPAEAIEATNTLDREAKDAMLALYRVYRRRPIVIDESDPDVQDLRKLEPQLGKETVDELAAHVTQAKQPAGRTHRRPRTIRPA